MRRRSDDAAWLAALLAVLVAGGLARPLLPIDETRYAAVAWEMWTRGDFLVPHLNGTPYTHKPPLLFWLMHAGWAVFGVNEWWPRLISPLFSAGTLALVVRLARGLWPQRPEAARMAPFVLLASALFWYFASALMFDAMLTFFVALGFVGLVRAWRGGAAAGGFVLLALGLGGALYAKGPVALVHLLPPALLAPWWMREQRPRWGRWYAGIALALLGGALLILAWALPAGQAGGEAYRNAIFWGQSAGRMVRSFAHREAWWFYLAFLPLMLAPWLLWPRWWLGLQRAALRQDSGLRLLALSLGVALVFFSAVSGKRWQYLLPEFPLFALMVARALAEGGRDGRGAAIGPALTLGALGAAALVAAPRLAARLAGLEDALALRWGGAIALACAVAVLLHRGGEPLAEVRRLATAAALAFSAVLVALVVAMREPYDLRDLAGRLAQYEREGRPVAINDNYHGQWTLAGRLRQPLEELSGERSGAWLAAHPSGRVLFLHRRPDEIPAGTRIERVRRYRGGWIAILAMPAPAAAEGCASLPAACAPQVDDPPPPPSRPQDGA